MFTGIVECQGQIAAVQQVGTNTTFWIKSSISDELKVDQSVAHNGVCLTVEEVKQGQHRITAIDETLKKSNLKGCRPGDTINLERCLAMNGRLDGHLVQGHVDCTATCIGKEDKDGSWEFVFEFPAKFAALVIEKGSICLNGVSLTVFNVGKNNFTVAIIPYTFTHTNLGRIAPGDEVNTEFDMIGKYVARLGQLGKENLFHFA